MSDISFKDAFVENMDALGLPAPSTLFTTLAAALANTKAIVDALKLLGPRVTMAELSTSFSAVAAGVHHPSFLVALSEIAAVAGAVAASFYIGAVIGSILVAAWRANEEEFGMALSWARQQCERLGMSLWDLVRRAMDALHLGWNNLTQLLAWC